MRCGIISTREVYRVACEHKRIKSVNCVLFCADCGARMERETASTAPDEAPLAKGEGLEKPKRTRKKKAEA